MKAIGTKFVFGGPYDQFADRKGTLATVIGHVTEPDDEHDEEVLPMYRIQFGDGYIIEAWPEEVEENAYVVEEQSPHCEWEVFEAGEPCSRAGQFAIVQKGGPEDDFHWAHLCTRHIDAGLEEVKGA